MANEKTNVRDEKQREVVKKYMQEKPMRCTLVLSTSFGKGKTAIDLIARLDVDKVLILVNSTVLRDKTWKEEFEKFGAKKFFADSVTIKTYQFMYKQSKLSFPVDKDTLVILDEVDFMGGTEELSKVMPLIAENRIIGLTGFITKSKEVWFANNLPVFMKFSASQAQDEGILNKVHYVFIKYDLSKNKKDITVNYKKNGVPKTFTQSENNAYDYANKQVAVQLEAKNQLSMDLADGSISYEQYMAELQTVEYKIRAVLSNRANILYNSVSSVAMTKRLLEYLQKDPNNKIVVFSKRTEQSEKIVGKNNVYNGSIKKHRAEAQYEQFVRGDIKVLGVCDKINRGANIPGLNCGVFETFNSSDTSATQIQGRFMRLEHDEVATIYVLLPYYMRSLPNNGYVLAETQQITWARKMLKSTTIKSSEVWDYRTVKEDPK
jgi:superfamily II DNA or RNA helicase